MVKVKLLIALLCLTGTLLGQSKQNLVQPHSCTFHERTQEFYEANPKLKIQLQEEMTKLAKGYDFNPYKNANCPNIITVPVVFHYLYDSNNLSDGYHNDNYVVNTILDGMNNYFSQSDAVDDNLPPAFQGTAADGTCIEWCLASYAHPQNNTLHCNDLNRDGIKDANGDGIIDEGEWAINRYALTTAQINNIRNTGTGSTQVSIIQGIAPAWATNEYVNVYVVPDLEVSSGGGVTAGYTYLPNNSSAGFNSIYMAYAKIF